MSGTNTPLHCKLTLLVAERGRKKNKDKRHDEPGLQLNLLHWAKDRMGVDEENLQVIDIEMIND